MRMSAPDRTQERFARDAHAAGRDERVRITLRPLGTPVAVGLAAILLGTTMLSGLQLGWLEGAADQRTVAYVALAAAFPLELLAATLAFLARDPLIGTGLATFSSVWSVSGPGARLRRSPARWKSSSTSSRTRQASAASSETRRIAEIPRRGSAALCASRLFFVSCSPILMGSGPLRSRGAPSA